jgi:hypothetical protein
MKAGWTGTAIGSVVNLASRLCASAEDGQTLIDPTAAAEIRQSVPLVALGTRTLRASPRPLQCSRSPSTIAIWYLCLPGYPTPPRSLSLHRRRRLLDKAAAYGSSARNGPTRLRAPFDIMMVPEAANMPPVIGHSPFSRNDRW